MKNKILTDLKLSELERGDYQTPQYFAHKVCQYVKEHLKCDPRIIIEPTCGLGNFIEASLDTFENIDRAYGIEIDGDYYSYLLNRFQGETVSIYNQNIFEFNFNEIKSSIDSQEEVLIIGNPPWVTNSELESLNSLNLPDKNNFKSLSGFDALTGKSNFDISEYIIIKLVEQFRNKNATIAMLCKNTVIRNIVRDIDLINSKISNIEMIQFDAKEVFNISCDASLFILKISDVSQTICKVYDIDGNRDLIRSFGWNKEKDTFVSDLDEYNRNSLIDGVCAFEWRQGVKHDCSKVMQLSKKGEEYTNGLHQSVELEDEFVYPLLKSSDIKNTIIQNSRKYVIITQKRVGEDTTILQNTAPKIWEYLVENANYLDNRKSSIYKKSPRFSIFGIGDYSFEPYKVCISGFYKEPKFSLAYRDDLKPIMLDDTCYFIGFNNLKNALITMILLNSNIVNTFLKSIAFLDSKRPYTKDVLKRLDIEKLYNNTTYQQFREIKNLLAVNQEISAEEYMNYGAIFLNSNPHQMPKVVFNTSKTIQMNLEL